MFDSKLKVVFIVIDRKLALHRTFCDILAIMFEDWNNYATIGENKQIMINKATLSSRISNCLIGYFSLTFVLYSGITLASFDEDNSESVSKTKKLFIKMKLPFDVTTSLLYKVILIVQFVFESFIVLAAVTSIALIATLVSI